MTAKFWDNMSKSYDEGIKKHDGLYDDLIRSTTSLLHTTDTVLEFGCASGEMSVDIARHVEKLVGIDISAGMIKLANQKIHDQHINNVNFEQIDIFDERLGRNSFSAIIAFNIIHLLDDAPNALARIHDLLGEGGLLISQTPCLGERNLLLSMLINFAHKLGLAPKVNSLTITELVSLVSGNGFEIVENKVWDADDAVQWIVARKI